MNDENIALVELYKDAVVEQKKEKKRWFLFSIFSNLAWALVFATGIIGFFIWDSHFIYEAAETTSETTTVYQDTGEGEGNNVYQAGEHATYNEGGE